MSRFHASFYLCSNGSLAIVDNFSKFGTLKLIRQPLQIDTLEPTFVQVGRVLLSLKIHREQKSLVESLCACLAGRQLKPQQLETSNSLHYEECALDFP